MTIETSASRTADARLADAHSLRAALPGLLAYPFGIHLLAVVALVAVFVGLGSQSLMGIPMLGITAIWSLHYVLQVVRETMAGRATAPAMRADVVFLDGWITARALVGPALAWTVADALEGVGHGTAYRLWWTLVALAAPAYLFVFAFEDDVRQALNPVRWLGFARDIGPRYLLPALMLVPLPWGLASLKGHLPIAALAAMGMLLLACSAHLLGVVVLLRREFAVASTMSPAPQAIAARRLQSHRVDLLRRRIEAHLQAQDEAGLVAALDVELPVVQQPAFFEALFEAVLARGQATAIRLVGRRLIDILVDHRRGERALEIYEVCDGWAPGFLPSSPAAARHLAQTAVRLRLEGRLAELVERAVALWPAHDDSRSMQLLMALMLAERHQDDAARSLAKTLLTYSDHPEYAQIRALARILGMDAGT